MRASIKMTRVEFRGGYVVRFWLNNGRYVDRDFMFLRGGVFERIWKDPRKFRRLRIVDGRPTWPGDIDLCPDTVLRGLDKGKILKNAVVGQGGGLIPATLVRKL